MHCSWTAGNDLDAVHDRLAMSDVTNASIYAVTPRVQFAGWTEPSPSPITTLPPELLIEIFAYCVFNEPLVPLSLRNVSWWWQDLVDTSPRLWQTIVLDDGDSRFSEQQAELWTERSKPLQYDIVLNVDDPDDILPLISPLLPTIDRWHAIRLSGKRHEEVLMDNLQITPDSLTHLHLCHHDYEQDDFDEDEPWITLSPISPGQTTNYALNLWISSLPSPTLLPPLRFVHVTIAEGGQVGLHTQPKYILEFLTACPELESFYLSGFPHDGPVDRPLPMVNLPNLVTLHLKSTCYARAILSSLNTPRLENLFLSHLNVDFELHSEYNEPGDSDDEAQDYSQSPWSDQATGMGLRKLISRSNPPIRVLEMDFCDMRTKDFRYVFDRLPLLEDFYIVASDMSNNVINLLRPIPPGFEDEEDNITRLRLPRLRKLRLMNCQRLTGPAIVDALTERVKWTDAKYPDFTLTDVMISGCVGFSPWDRHVLSTVLQNRLML